MGVDVDEPKLPLERTEFVQADSTYAILQRIVRATRVDTVLHTHLEVDSTRTSSRRLHEVNVIGTTNLLAAAGAADSPVRRLIVKTSTLVYGSSYTDPYWFREETPRGRAASTPVERSLLEIGMLLRDFADDNPSVAVSELRFANVLGSDLSTVFSRMLRMPAVPEVFGFDPRLQFVHEDDVTAALAFAARHEVPGVFNVAGPRTTTWSAVCAAVGRRRIPMPPLRTAAAATPLRLARIVDIPPEVLSLLRYGRGVDTVALRRRRLPIIGTTLRRPSRHSPARCDWNGWSGVHRRTATRPASRRSSGTHPPSGRRCRVTRGTCSPAPRVARPSPRG